MTHIEQMIKDMCPHGVEWKQLGEVATLSRGKVYSKEYLRDNAGEYPVYSSQTANNGELGRINTYDYDGKFLTWTTDGAYAGTVFRREGKFSITNVCGLISKVDKSLSIDFLYYWLNKVAKGYVYQGMGNPKLMSNVMETIEIPIPPLEIQKKIVECLDKFSALAAELQAELQKRRTQYEYYRTRLLTPPPTESNSATNTDERNWEWKTLGEIGTFTRGRRFVRTDIVDEGQPCIHYGDMYTYYGLATDHARTHLPKDFPVKLRYAEKGDVIIVGAGENDMDIGVGCVWEGEEPVAVHDACYIFKHKQYPRFISHYLRTLDYHLQIKKNVSTAKICAISPEGIAKAKIALPPFAEQKRIADFLDKFEVLLTSLSDGIPAEQAAQQKRYEYYRDLLLTFPRKDV